VRQRKTVALLLDYMGFISGSYETDVRDAFDRACREQDLNLLLFFGGAVDDSTPSISARNSIFELARSSEVDAIAACSTVLATRSGAKAVAQLLERHADLPLCSLGIAFPNVPSIVVDNQSGMASVVEHMIRVHARRRIAFIAGSPANPEASVRLRTYEEVLARHGIPFDARLVVQGQFVRSEAYSAMAGLIESGVEFDSVVAANDAMALGAINALRKRRYRVPRDVPVAGFDDLTVARLGNPPLTTVAQPFDAMAATAVRVLVDQLQGRSVESCTQLSCEFIARQSCGCDVRPWSKESIGTPETARDVEAYLAESGDRIERAVTSSLRSAFRDRSREAEQLIEGLRQEVTGNTGSFLLVIEELLDEASGDDDDIYQGLENAIACLRGALTPFATSAIDDLWHAARDRINRGSRAGQVRHRVELDDAFVRLLLAAEQISAVADLASLQRVLTSHLPTIGVTDALLARYSDIAPGSLEPFLWLQDGAPRDLPSQASLQLFPADSYVHERRHTTMVFPLTSEAQRFGAAFFEYTSVIRGHQMLEEQIGAALRSVWLQQEVTQKTMLHERSVQERLATAARMQALSVLAGGVAHDLNNVLGPLVALPEVIQRELDHFAGSESQIESFRADMDSMGAAAQRASQTIKDLLTLSRQGKTHKEPVDLNLVVERHLSSDALRFLLESNPHITVRQDLDGSPLVVRASESQLTRAIENLVRNAAEAISGRGEVLIRTGLTRISEPFAGFETVEPGDYALVIVADNGNGISVADLGRVFEPFFSKKRVRDQNGSGSGSGLGLAIVHGVVKEHEGFVDVQSSVGTGTTFSLYFPLTDSRISISERESLPPPGRARILLVDDEPIQLRTGRRVLRHLGYEVDTLESGHRARELFAKAANGGKSPYDLVILDMILNEPEDGLQVLEHIQNLFPAQRAVLASGHAPSERAELAVSKGLTWLVKPYTMDTLARTVRALLPSSDSARAPRRPSEH
jgi:DNA-binding LacI/PurR family transcriptional regulator/signal transduction histidine kinase/ActR/RegA family two-component response regulator